MFTARFKEANEEEGSTVPRKIDLYWFIPALTKRREGSLCGKTEADWTRCWISTKERYWGQKSLVTEGMAKVFYKVAGESVPDALSRPLDLDSIGGSHFERKELVLLDIYFKRLWSDASVEGSRII